jgi:hypothetical protein
VCEESLGFHAVLNIVQSGIRNLNARAGTMRTVLDLMLMFIKDKDGVDLKQ